MDTAEMIEWVVEGPFHAIPESWGGGLAITGTATGTLTFCPLMEPYMVVINLDSSSLGSPERRFIICLK